MSDNRAARSYQAIGLRWFLEASAPPQTDQAWGTWNGYCKLAGVPGLHFRDLRRTALTNMIDAGIPEKVAMEVSGHVTRKTFERDHIVSDRNIREVATRMEDYLGNRLAGNVMGKVQPTVQANLIELK